MLLSIIINTFVLMSIFFKLLSLKWDMEENEIFMKT